MNEQGDLFDDRRDLTRRTDPGTSHDAAAQLNLGRLHRLTVAALDDAEDGMLTTIEIGRVNGIERDTISPRIPRLVKDGLVVWTEKKRVPEGKKCKSGLLLITERGREWRRSFADEEKGDG